MASEKKTRKKMSAKVFTCIIAPLLAILWVISIVLPILSVTKYDLVFRDIFGEAAAETSGNASADGVDTEYYKSDYKSIKDLEAAEQKYAREGGAEGLVLLYNNTEGEKGLPVKAGSKLSLFSQTSVDLLAGGTGSGVSTISSDMRTALTEQGFTVNEALWNFYQGTGKKRGAGSVSYGMSQDWALNETPISEIPENAKTEAKGTTPVFFFGRTGGEGVDLARWMGGESDVLDADKDKHYLEPNSTELGIISYLNDNFDNVIVVVNTNNAFELGWIENYPNITSVLWAPGAGGDTCRSVADILSGKINPSGHLVDTFAYDAFSSPAMQNMGDIDLLNGGKVVGNGVFYDEGIYVGYKYYETRYYDKQAGAEKVGDYDYAATVQYPFGYGLSYTTFEWSGFTVGEMDANKDIEISVTVKNTGKVAGKEVVQVYLNAPYTDYDRTNHIEKASASLVGFEKTKELAPDASETVKIKVNQKDLISYDDVQAKTYILEAGDYLLTAAHNAHEANNNFLVYNGKDTDGSQLFGAGDKTFVGKYTYSYTENGGVDKTTYSKSLNGTEITNQFDHALWAGHQNITERTQYLTRQDWEGTFPKHHGTQNSKKSGMREQNGLVWELEVDKATADQLAKVGADASLNPMTEEEAGKKAGVYGQEGTLELIDFRGLDYNELETQGKWDKLIDQMTTANIKKIIRNAGYQTLNDKNINKPRAIDFDGPSGLNEGGVTHSPYSITYPCAANIAASWNRENSRLHGYYVSEDALHADETSFGSHQYKGIISGWYAPAMNIHRTPFAGRNFEYYSEDGFMSGEMALQASRETAQKGVYSYIKHFALNDQESHRSSVATFSNEQAIREIYLKPFQTCIEERGTQKIFIQEFDQTTNAFVKKEMEIPAVMAVMTAFNRVGCTWAGGNYQLITKVLRQEWGFNGSVITDYDNGGYMNTEQCIRAGGDLKLTAQGGMEFDMKNPATQYYARQAMKHILYTTVNSNAMNGFVHGVVAADLPFAYYWLIIISIWVLTIGLTAWGATAIVLRFKKERAAATETADGDAPDAAGDETPETRE